MTEQEYVERKVRRFNETHEEPGHDIDCPICLNKRVVAFADERNGNWYEVTEECTCVKEIRRAKERKRAGVDGTLSEKNFRNFVAKEEWEQRMLNISKVYADAVCSGGMGWFFVGGQVGCGKTHLCASIVNQMIEHHMDIGYITWSSYASYSEEKAQELDRLKWKPYLYIDDFLRGNPKDYEIRKAFELIDFRYANNLPTIVSSEKHIQELMRGDTEAIASRIREKAIGKLVNIARSPEKNKRLHDIPIAEEEVETI